MGREVEGDGIAGITGAGASSTAAPSSRTDGSDGGGPSFAHLRDSYFERINDSILLKMVTQCMIGGREDGTY